VICHGPGTLVEVNLVRGRTLTSYIRTDLRNAGGNVVDEEVVTDQGLVSSRGPDDLRAFCSKIVEEFARASIGSTTRARPPRRLPDRPSRPRTGVGPPMLQANVAEGVHRIEDAYTNWYLLEEDGCFTIVDAGVPSSWESLTDAMRQLGHGLDRIEALVLTHAHFDHIGFAERARSELGIPVWVHQNDEPLTRKPHQYGHERPRSFYLATQPRALPIIATFARERAFFPKPISEVTRYEAGRLPVPGSPKVLFTPGHTLGHCSFHLAERDALIAGDAVVTLNPYRGLRGPQIVSGAATVDSERALASLDGVAETGARTVLCGHGEPWTDGAEAIATRARAAGPS
jgi:glyoxylase-like metal-dependent hydrolase (beta-lactamase superfamily II)